MEEKDCGKEPGREQDRFWSGAFIRGMVFGLLLAISLLMAGFFVLLFAGRGKVPQGAGVLTSPETLLKLQAVKGIVEDGFYYETDPELLGDSMFRGIAAGLNDRYACYYSAQDRRQMEIGNEGSYYGLGITVSRDEDERYPVLVLSVYEDSPAQRAGILAGDRIVSVEGDPVSDLSVTEVVERIGSFEQAGKVSLVLERDGREHTFVVAFEDIAFGKVQVRILKEKTGYIRIPEFDHITVESFREALKKLKEEGCTKLVVDLRDNPGGLLDSVCDILRELLPAGPIVQICGRDGTATEVIESEGNPAFTGPIAVLTNNGSASASEVFAGAIQDYGLGPVIGKQTFGKGVVQRTYSFADGSALKLTTEGYRTPEGRDIEGTGIVPDVEMEVDEEPEESVLEQVLPILDSFEKKDLP